jgi:hypothetical protein
VVNSSVNLSNFSIFFQVFYIKKLMKTLVIIRDFFFFFFFFFPRVNSKHNIYIYSVAFAIGSIE